VSITLTYNGYTHEAGEAVISVSRQSLLTAAETVYAETVQIAISGTIIRDGVSAIDTRIAALAAAYASDGGDFAMIDSTAGSLSPSLTSAETLGGIRVMRRPSLPDMKNAAYVTFLNYQILLEAVVVKSSAWTLLRSFREEIQFSGGGPVYGCLQTRVGLPQRQLLAQHAIYRAVQSGSAVGLYSVPTIPSPYWPAWLVSLPETRYAGGHPVGAYGSVSYMDFGVSWRYVYESPVPMIGSPASWGVS